MVGALKLLAPAGSARNHVAAVSADVQERAQLAVAGAGDDDGDLSGGGREEGAFLGDLAAVAGVLPGAREDPLALTAKDLRIGIPGPGQRPFHG